MVKVPNKASQRDGARVLWNVNPAELVFRLERGRIRSPGALISAAPANTVLGWLTENMWARSLPLFLFDGNDAPVLGKMSGMAYVQFQTPGEGPHGVGGPEGQIAALKACGFQRAAGHVRTSSERIDTLAKVAGTLASMFVDPVWEVCADASGGVLAIGAAAGQNGPACAVSAHDPPGGFFGPVATAWGVPIHVHLDRQEQQQALDPSSSIFVAGFAGGDDA